MPRTRAVPALLVAIAALVACAVPAVAQQQQQESAAELARRAQNPVADLISLPLQNNTSFGIGPENQTQNTLNIQPVIPVNVGKWNLINRPILPLVWQPDVAAGSGSTFGLGDLTYELFISPAEARKVTWGLGPVLIIPTATSDETGSGKWAAGPTGVVVATVKKWVVGFVTFQAWSFAGDSDRASTSSFLFQYFLNYNLPNAWYLSSAPIITANWKASSDDRWIVPLGGGGGKVFAIGKQKMNAQGQIFYNVVKPDNLDGPDWSLRLQIQFLFPK